MKQNPLFLLTLFIATAFISQRLYAQTNVSIPKSTAPMVIELFTSQGCPSCPPADRILKELVKQDTIIALSCHVSYWDQPKWKDALSNEMCDVRQHGYASLTTAKRIYTPQMIVNGTDIFIGSDNDDLNLAIEKANNTEIAAISISTKGDEHSFTMPSVGKESYRIWGFGYKKSVTHKIGGGKNSGREINYANPVTEFINLGAWDGEDIMHEFEMSTKEIDGIAIIAQEGGYSRIVAAGKIEF